MTPPLCPCPECARHVRAGSSACPFCGVELPRAFASIIDRRRPGRIGRAAIFAFRTLAIGGAAVGCGSATGLESAPSEAFDAGAGMDGGSSLSDAGFDAGFDAGRLDAGQDGGGGIIAAYGGPVPLEDAGGGDVPAYGGPPPPLDAGPDDAGGTGNLYGAPPP